MKKLNNLTSLFSKAQEAIYSPNKIKPNVMLYVFYIKIPQENSYHEGHAKHFSYLF